MKIVYNACFGGFSLSPAGERRYCELAELDDVYSRNLKRSDPLLVQVVEELGQKANGSAAKLQIAEVPAGVRYRIDEYDGNESVMTVDDYAWEVAE